MKRSQFIRWFLWLSAQKLEKGLPDTDLDATQLTLMALDLLRASELIREIEREARIEKDKSRADWTD